MAFLLPWTCVLLGCFSVSLAGAYNFSDLYPPLWKKSASQFSDYRVKNGKYIIDPWVYPERMGMYKILVNKTASYFENILLDNEQNILWGLPLQNGWQYKTGRLADPRRRTDCGYDSDPLCVSVDSWWADMNYFLCALPFLAAVDSGIMGISSDQVMLLPPPKDQTKFCLNVSSCRSSFPEIMSKWNAFYQHLQYPSSTFEDLLKYLWAAHVATIDTVGKIFEDRLEYYSKAEANFGRNWCVAVDYLAASLFPTTLVRTHEFQEGLPPRMLVNGDRAPFISDFTEFQNTVLLLLSFLSQVDNFPALKANGACINKTQKATANEETVLRRLVQTHCGKFPRI
ncbi:protein LEG1 homolog [Canis lupus familiaris]|uniref:protein LEG1 homolog n=1 Tax=Canis lupus familiaris TaxID=9615 RepID=UPI0018F3F5F7|nr:protein LEG1 homolog [Canis lupus familiaris]